MPCLEPGKKLSPEEQKILLMLDKLSEGDKLKLAKEGGFALSLVVRKLRALGEKGLIVQEGDIYKLNDKGKEAVKALGENK